MCDAWIYVCGIITGIVALFVYGIIATEFGKWVDKQRKKAVTDYIAGKRDEP